jgi:hypothetical protein
MASFVYQSGLSALMSGLVDVVNTPVLAMLVDTTLYTASQADDASLADIPEAALLGESLIVGRALVGSAFRADPTVFSDIPESATTAVGAVIIAVDAETYEGSTLLYYSDEAPEIPFLPEGEAITISWGAVDPGTGDSDGVVFDLSNGS